MAGGEEDRLAALGCACRRGALALFPAARPRTARAAGQQQFAEYGRVGVRARDGAPDPDGDHVLGKGGSVAAKGAAFLWGDVAADLPYAYDPAGGPGQA